MRSKVVLPEPLGPATSSTSPQVASRSRWASAHFCPYLRDRSRARNAVAGVSDGSLATFKGASIPEGPGDGTAGGSAAA